MLFVWNGKEANALLKATALTKGFELDTLLNKSGDPLLSFIFNGGVVRGTRLQRGKVLVFDQASSEQENNDRNENPNTPDTERVLKSFETVYLFQWLVPDSYLEILKNQNSKSVVQKSVIEQTMYPKFRKYFFPVDEEQSLVSNDKAHDYQTRFKWVDNLNSRAEEVVDRSHTSEEMLRAEGEIGNQFNLYLQLYSNVINFFVDNLDHCTILTIDV